MQSPKLTEEEKKERKKQNNYHWKTTHPTYLQEWRSHNTNKIKQYKCKRNNLNEVDRKYPELSFI